VSCDFVAVCVSVVRKRAASVHHRPIL